MDVSELLPHIATCVDDMAFVRSVQAENGNHPAAVFLMNTGFVIPGNPSIGAWLTMGSAPRIRICPPSSCCPISARFPSADRSSGAAGSCRQAYQGTVLRWKGEPIRDLKPPAGLSPEGRQAQMDLLRAFNQEYLSKHRPIPGLAGAHRRV